MPGWFVCFLAFETPQWMEPQQHPLLLFGEGDLLREHCSYAWTYWHDDYGVFFAPKTSLWNKVFQKAAPLCSDLKVISKQAEIFMKGRCFVEGLRKAECWESSSTKLKWWFHCLVLSICAWWSFKMLTFSMLLQQLRYLCQAVMKFHGVGNPSKTPAEATALEMGRGPKATACSWHSLWSYTSITWLSFYPSVLSPFLMLQFSTQLFVLVWNVAGLLATVICMFVPRHPTKTLWGYGMAGVFLTINGFAAGGYPTLHWPLPYRGLKFKLWELEEKKTASDQCFLLVPLDSWYSLWHCRVRELLPSTWPTVFSLFRCFAQNLSDVLWSGETQDASHVTFEDFESRDVFLFYLNSEDLHTFPY